MLNLVKIVQQNNILKTRVDDLYIDLDNCDATVKSSELTREQLVVFAQMQANRIKELESQNEKLSLKFLELNNDFELIVSNDNKELEKEKNKSNKHWIIGPNASFGLTPNLNSIPFIKTTFSLNIGITYRFIRF